MKLLRKCLAVVLAGVFVQSFASLSFAGGWRTVKKDRLYSISGMALLGHDRRDSRFLVVHDNKRPGERRFAVISVKGRGKPAYESLAWPEGVSEPVDIEALATVPGDGDCSFLALTSGGGVSWVKLDPERKTIVLMGRFSLPCTGRGENYEGLALYEIEDKLLAAWGHRGLGSSPGVAYWAFLDLPNRSFDAVSSANISVPWPKGGNVRHISDLAIDKQGVLFASAASDPGDEGPFDSAVYRIGRFASDGSHVSFEAEAEPERMLRLRGHKAEALALVPYKSGARFAVASDDENKGSSVYLSR